MVSVIEESERKKGTRREIVMLLITSEQIKRQ